MEYLIGSEENFWNFVNSINKEKDKIAIRTHTDLDGIASALFLELILETKGFRVALIEFGNYDSGMFEKFEEKISGKGITKVFFSDCAGDLADLEGFDNFRKNFDSFLIDHHPINPDLKNKKNILKTGTTDCSSLVVYNFLDKDLKEKWKWLVCAAIISDFSFKKKENFEFVKKNDSELLYEEPFSSKFGKVANLINNALIYFEEDKKKVYDLIKQDKILELNKYGKEVEEEIQKYVKNYKNLAEFYPERKLYFYFLESKYKIGSTVSTIISSKNPDSIFIVVSNSPNEKNMLNLSARNQSCREDMNFLLKNSLNGLKNAGGGGHMPAAGGRIMKGDLEIFKKRILNL
jgi:single-stranded DNA-specific DHH superfamily exonuclease